MYCFVGDQAQLVGDTLRNTHIKYIVFISTVKICLLRSLTVKYVFSAAAYTYGLQYFGPLIKCNNNNNNNNLCVSNRA